MDILSVIGSFSWIVWAVAAFVWYRVGKMRGRREEQARAQLERELRPVREPTFSIAFSPDAPDERSRTGFTHWITPNGVYGLEMFDAGLAGTEVRYARINQDRLVAYRNDNLLFVATVVPGGPSLSTLEELRGIGDGYHHLLSPEAHAEVMGMSKSALFRSLCVLNALPGFAGYMERAGVDFDTFFDVPAPTQDSQAVEPRRRVIDLD